MLTSGFFKVGEHIYIFIKWPLKSVYKHLKNKKLIQKSPKILSLLFDLPDESSKNKWHQNLLFYIKIASYCPLKVQTMST